MALVGLKDKIVGLDPAAHRAVVEQQRGDACIKVVALLVYDELFAAFLKKLRDAVYENHNLELSQKWAPLLNVKKTDFIKEGAILEIHVGNTLHIAVALDKVRMIHATTNQGVRISKIAAYKIAGIYEVI